MKPVNAKHALLALQRVVTRARFFAYTGRDTQDIAWILDQADYLISMILYEDDSDGDFLRVLQDIGKKFPELAFIANEYERETQLIATHSDAGREAA